MKMEFFIVFPIPGRFVFNLEASGRAEFEPTEYSGLRATKCPIEYDEFVDGVSTFIKCSTIKALSLSLQASIEVSISENPANVKLEVTI